MVSSSLVEHAPAKINLSLHIVGRRDDGFHDLESLVAFTASGDSLALDLGSPLSLVVDGPTAPNAGALEDNLVLRAARALAARVPELESGRFHLTKRLPVAAGIGGGSSDAAAALRLLARANDLALDDPRLYDAAAEIGSDVPVCMAAQARMMLGVVSGWVHWYLCRASLRCWSIPAYRWRPKRFLAALV